jgi:ribosomal 50S subunit-associated protein YjgA (DUF615 family)
MMRTTVDIDDPVLNDLKKLQKKEGKSLGRLISDLLAQAIGDRKSAKAHRRSIQWISKDMGARVDVADTEAVYSAMDEKPRPKTVNNRS